MSILTLQPLPPVQGPPYPVYRLTVEGFHGMIRTGLLAEDDRVELLEGWIVPKMVHNPLHDGTVQRANKAIARLLPQSWDIRVQSAITTGDSEPEPDLAVVREDPGSYLTRHPGPDDIGLVVEVAESSLVRDQTDKARLYARAGIVRYWIINLVDGRVEVYSDPTGPSPIPAYRQHQDFDRLAMLPFPLDGKEIGQIPVRDLLP